MSRLGPTRSILLIGPQWHGSNARGLAVGFRQSGALVQTVDSSVFIPTAASGRARIVRRALRPLFRREFNAAILREDLVLVPDVVVVFKGDSVRPETIAELKKRGRLVTQFYPDVSMFTHGNWIPRTMPLYDHIFTTKSFGLRDLIEGFNIDAASVVPHGFDPDIHRVIPVPDALRRRLACDVSFIGTWSPKKEQLLSVLLEQLPKVELKIWGAQWNRAITPTVRARAQGNGLLGDLYPAAIQCCKINLAILSEARTNASSGDLITSRTFHIPASGGFMLHERTAEVLQFYEDRREIGTFAGAEDIAQRVEHYLENDEERAAIAEAGRRRCVASNSWPCRARMILDKIEELLLQGRSAVARVSVV